MIPLAHIGHWLWVFYVMPIVIVIVGIVVSTRAANRRERQNERDHPSNQSREDR